jgi:hypothetical protein
VDTPSEEEARRARREERKVRRSVDPANIPGDKDRLRNSRRRSEHPEDHVTTSRNADFPANPVAQAIKKGGDKTASWVHSLNDSNPDPPPVERTVLDAPIHGDDGVPDRHPLEGEDKTARELRQSQRRRKERELDDAGRRRRRDEEGPVRSSDGSSGKRRSSYAPVNSLGAGDMGARGFDGRPAMPGRGDSKRGSWFKKIAGL